MAAMRYEDFREAIRGELARRRAGLTWAELRDQLGLPYERACPEWTRRLEREIGLRRGKGEKGNALVWTVGR